MTALELTIRAYLKRIGQDDVQDLGGGKKQSSEADKKSLSDSLQRQQDSSQKIIVVAVAMLCVLFALGVFLVIYYRDSPTTLGLVLGGDFFSLLVIVAWLRRLWFEKSTMDALLLIIAELTPTEAAKAITSFHFRAVKLKRYGRP